MGSSEEDRVNDGEEVKEEPQKIYVTAFIQSVLPQREPVYVINVTCVNIASPTASHFEYGACKTMTDFVRLDAALRLGYNSQLKGVVLPSKKKQGTLLRKIKGMGLKKKQKKMGQYLSALLMADILSDSDYFQQFLLLDTMPMPRLHSDGSESLEEQAKERQKHEVFQFSTDAALMDEIEKNALSVMESAIEVQKETVKRLRSASSAKPTNQEVQKQLKEQEAELNRMNEEFETVKDIKEAPRVTIETASVPDDIPVMNMPEPESPREPPSAPDLPTSESSVPSVPLESGNEDGDESDVEASPRTNKHADRAFRLSMVLRAKKQTLRQTVNFDQLFANGDIDDKYKMA